VSPTYQDVEAAIAGVDGVADATVRTTEGSSRGRLRIRLVPGHDPDTVSHQVADVLRTRFGIDIDPAAIRPTPATDDGADDRTEDGAEVPAASAPTEPEAPAAPTEPEAPAAAASPAEPAAAARPVAEESAEEPAAELADEPPEPAVAAATVPDPDDDDAPVAARAGLPGVDELFRPTARGAQASSTNGGSDVPAPSRSFHRPLIRDLALGNRGLEIAAEVLLDLDGTEIRGRAVGPATRRSTFRAIARATLDAVEAMFPGSVKTELETIELDDDGVDERVTVTVTFLTEAGADRLVGVSLSRGDAEQAVLRATLDAVNRRVGLLLDD
jgi:hypothetical protein